MAVQARVDNGVGERRLIFRVLIFDYPAFNCDRVA